MYLPRPPAYVAPSLLSFRAFPSFQLFEPFLVCHVTVDLAGYGLQIRQCLPEKDFNGLHLRCGQLDGPFRFRVDSA